MQFCHLSISGSETAKLQSNRQKRLPASAWQRPNENCATHPFWRKTTAHLPQVECRGDLEVLHPNCPAGPQSPPTEAGQPTWEALPQNPPESEPHVTQEQLHWCLDWQIWHQSHWESFACLHGNRRRERWLALRTPRKEQGSSASASPSGSSFDDSTRPRQPPSDRSDPGLVYWRNVAFKPRSNRW